MYHVVSHDLLHVLLLQVTRGDVVERRVTEDVIQRVALRDVAPGLPDDRAELDLPVHLLGDRAVSRDVVERSGDRRSHLGLWKKSAATNGALHRSQTGSENRAGLADRQRRLARGGGSALPPHVKDRSAESHGR